MSRLLFRLPVSSRRTMILSRFPVLVALGAFLAGSAHLFAAAPLASAYDGMVLPFKEVLVIAVTEGDTVTAGQPLARLYSRLEELDMARAKAALEKREFDARGAERLFADKIIPEDKAIEARIERDLAKLQYEMAAEQVRIRTITAPLDGLVVEKTREAGEAVAPAQPFLRIVDISRVYVQFFIKVEELDKFRVGQPLSARFSLLNGGRPFAGTVDFIDPRVDAASGLLRVKVLVENPARLIKAGMRAEVVPTPPAAP
jgi:RND family efflux transporter MFP subunit